MLARGGLLALRCLLTLRRLARWGLWALHFLRSLLACGGYGTLRRCCRRPLSIGHVGDASGAGLPGASLPAASSHGARLTGAGSHGWLRAHRRRSLDARAEEESGRSQHDGIAREGGWVRSVLSAPPRRALEHPEPPRSRDGTPPSRDVAVTTPRSPSAQASAPRADCHAPGGPELTRARSASRRTRRWPASCGSSRRRGRCRRPRCGTRAA